MARSEVIHGLCRNRREVLREEVHVVAAEVRFAEIMKHAPPFSFFPGQSILGAFGSETFFPFFKTERPFGSETAIFDHAKNR